MEHIKITLPEVTNLSSQIRLINSNLDDVLEYVKRTMNDLDCIWNSDGSSMIKQRFNQFSNRFTQESEVIESYAKFLDYTVASYDNLESTINSNASSF